MCSRLILSYQDLNTLPLNIIDKHGHDLEELDLTGNHISDFKFLLDLPQLHTLVIDRNGLTSHVHFPECPQLRILWANHNRIDNLDFFYRLTVTESSPLTITRSVFVATISHSFPSLTQLSIMNNDAAPSYFNGGTVAQYRDYRCYTISQLPKLTFLDDAPVTETERRAAESTYTRMKKRRK